MSLNTWFWGKLNEIMDANYGACHRHRIGSLWATSLFIGPQCPFIGRTHSRHPGNPHGCKPIATSCSCKENTETSELTQSGNVYWVPGKCSQMQAVLRVVGARTVMGEHGVRVHEARIVSP